MADALHGLEDDPENVRAWRLYHRVASRFAADLHVGGLMVERLTADLSPEDFQDAMERLTVLYDALSPAPEAQS